MRRSLSGMAIGGAHGQAPRSSPADGPDRAEESEAERELRALVHSSLGPSLRNPVRERYVTCETCSAPLSGPAFRLCQTCAAHRREGVPLANRVVPLAYAVLGRRSGVDMRSYKAHMSEECRLGGEAWRRLSLLVAAFGLWHAACVPAESGQAVTALAAVPSLRGRRGPHPLSGLGHFLPRSWREFELLPADPGPLPTDRRSLSPAHFTVDAPATVTGRHVVVLEDTWVSGGHAQSAAAAIRAAGAAEVTVVAVARLLSPGYPPSAAFIEQRLHGQQGYPGPPAYDVDVCPVTGGDCPG